MADRSELVEAALEMYPEGLAVMDPEGRVVFWNQAAETMTGFTRADVLGRPIPVGLEPLTFGGDSEEHCEPGHRSRVHAQHKNGHDVAAMTGRVILRNGLGKSIGTAAVFHSEQWNALPHGETSEGSEVRQSQEEFRARLENGHEMWVQQVSPLALLWIAVDQAGQLRKTHGARACETMLEIVERTLANALRPGEEIGRWGDDEFLVLTHESSPEFLRSRAQVLGGLASTADFRWWGDRVSVTVSAGAAVCEAGETIPELLERARAAMEDSARAGGNHVTLAAPRQP